MNHKRRILLAVPLASVALVAYAKARERVIKIEARKFRYSPNVIEVKKGEDVVLELTAVDFPHGFSLPDFNIRADLIMDKPVRVKLKADKAGQFGFLCDNFCGSGHEEMAGKLIVKG